MFENIERDADERGQVGIGTLIVFIALVLVAAIAAGVLINTAGFLQSQAESTGQESTQQVSNNLQVKSVIGVTPDSSGAGAGVDEVKVRVALGPGADPIDLSQATFEFVGDANYRGKIDTGTDGITVKDLSGSSNTVLKEGETRIIGLESGQSTNAQIDENLEAGDEGTLTITTADGSSTRVDIVVPSPITSSEPVKL
jgi:flagellin FlaB